MTISLVTDEAARIRLRFRTLLQRSGVSQSQLCARMTQRTGERWRDSRLSKMLNGHIVWSLSDLLLMAEEANISLVEVFRDPSREYVADLTPSELRLIHALRDYPGIALPLMEVVRRLTPETRRPSRAVIRAQMRRAKEER